MHEGRASHEDALAVVQPRQTVQAWCRMGEIPPEMWAAVRLLPHDPEAAYAALIVPGLANAPAPSELQDRWKVLAESDVPPEAAVYQLCSAPGDPAAGTDPPGLRAYQPERPAEAEWPIAIHRRLGKDSEGRTLRTEMVAALDEAGVDDEGLRAEMIAYFEALDQADGRYRDALAAQAIDERIDAEAKR